MGTVALHRVRSLDDFTRECLAIEVDTALSGERATRVLDRVLESRGKPAALVTDNGPEFAGPELDAGRIGKASSSGSSARGKPIENCFVESFNGKFRAEPEPAGMQWLFTYVHRRGQGLLGTSYPEEPRTLGDEHLPRRRLDLGPLQDDIPSILRVDALRNLKTARSSSPEVVYSLTSLRFASRRENASPPRLLL